MMFPLVSFVDFSNKKLLNPFVTKEHHSKRKDNRFALLNSQSVGSLEERIRRERRSNTIAPSFRITEPNRFVQSKLFAKPFFRSTKIVEENEDDEPIIVKVRYNPELGEKPSEEFVRRLIDRPLKSKRDEPIILNFLGRGLQTSQTFSHLPPRPIIYRPAYTALPRPGPIEKVSMAHTTQNHSINSSNDVFRPSAVTDVPELSKDNLLSMLNQIPDLKGRQFKIEYASTGAPESYPLPFHLDSTTTSDYPEPVVIDKLPSNVIQHVKTSNNPALAAALDAAIAQEQSSSQQNRLNNSSGSTFHYTGEHREQLQESRPVSSDSSTEEVTSSSDDESESETESEDSELVALARA